MHDALETYEHAGQTIHIHADDCDRDSPREWDNLGTIAYQGRTSIGDVELREWEGEFYDRYDREPVTMQDWIPFLREVKGATVILPVYSYEHGGVTIRCGDALDRDSNPFSCPWDSGLAGFIFDTPESREVCGTPEERIAECLKGEVKTMDQYLTGEVYGYIVETEHDDHADSCWGFYDLDDCKSEAESAAEWHRDKQAREAAELGRMAAVWRE